MKDYILSSPFLHRLLSKIILARIKKKKNLQYGKNILVTKSSIFEGTNSLGNNTKFISSYLGFGSYISEDSNIVNTKIGKFCSLGPYIKCVFGNHPTSKFVSTHPSFFSTRRQVNLSFVDENKFIELAKDDNPSLKYSITIDNDVWIAANVTILDGVTIGNGAIIAANSLVNKDVAPYTIVGGVPAKIIKKRFTDSEIEFLNKLQWWDKPIKWIESFAPAFDDIKTLMNSIEFTD